MIFEGMIRASRLERRKLNIIFNIYNYIIFSIILYLVLLLVYYFLYDMVFIIIHFILFFNSYNSILFPFTF